MESRLIHSETIEDIFRYSGTKDIGKPFAGAGSPGFPYIELPTIAFHDKKYYEEQVDAWNLFSKMYPISGNDATQGMSPKQKSDLEWRANHLSKKLDFWDMVRADFPYLLTERLVGQLSPRNRKLRAMIGSSPDQAISTNEIFNNAMLMISPLRQFHRSDGRFST